MRESWQTLIDVLRFQAQRIGGEVVFTFLSGPREERITFAELDTRARAVAVQLQRHCAPGDRAMLIYPVGLRYIEAFFGCLYAGVIAVPAYPPHPSHASRGLQKFKGIVTDAQPAVMLATERLIEMLRSVRDATPELQIPWLTTDGGDTHAERWVEPRVGGDDLAFLQYTSGSTAEPKGVMVRHRNLLANLELILRTTPRKPGELLVSWLPPYHDMGLIGSILLPVYGGGPAVLMPPASFLQRPLWWLETIARFRATYGAAPDFAYDLCVRAAEQGAANGLDLSSWTTFLDGAEPVRADTLAAFHRTFGPNGVPKNGITPSYGLAEATLMVSVSDPKVGCVQLDVDRRALEQRRAVRVDEGQGRRLVSSGRVDAVWDLRVVDPEQRRELGDGEIGEIWLRGPCVTAGYWRKPELTRETFEAQLSTGGDERFLRTGDLGFVDRGDVYVTGRIKEMICVRGRNLYPHDLERAVEPLAAALPQLRGTCLAAGVEIDGREEIVLFHEIDRRAGTRRKARREMDSPNERRRGGDRRSRRIEARPGPARAGRAEDEVAVAIATAASRELEVRVAAVVLVAPGTLPRTSSGKARRLACRNSFACDFADGALRVIHVWQPGLERMPAERAVPTVVERDYLAPARSQRTYRELSDWLTERFAAKMGVPPDAVDVHRPFVEFGLDSAIAIEIAAKLSEYVDDELSPTLLWDEPNIDALASALACDRAPAAVAVNSTPSEATPAEPIAIVGMACKLPGADDLEAFWSLLSEGRSGITEGAEERYRELGGDDASLRVPPRGGFVSEIDRFDAGFFSISAREAAEMDPQQRMLLEVGFHALEDTSRPPSRWAASHTGVFVGISSSDYGMIAARDGRATDVHSGTGNAHSIAANRLSYAFDLRGPSLAVDTACSSSLLAVHLGCESLRRRECDAVLVAGVNALLSPVVTATFVKAQMIAQDGRCKTFSADADGYVRSEGCAAFVLKRLSDAERDGDRIRAVIRGSAVNQDGRSNGLTAPNGGAQRAVVRAALASAGIAPEAIDYIEAHGTGTSLGDPIEAAALGAVLASTERERPWLLGAVKANIGHLEAAAGAAGLAKVVLCLEREAIPAQIHLTSVNPKVDLEAMRAQIPRERTEWVRGSRARRAGVSSFGFGGTNVHVVLEEAPVPEAVQSTAAELPVLLAVSARSEASLKQLTAILGSHFDARGPAEFTNACASVSATRSEFPFRLAVVARSAEHAAAELRAFAAGAPNTGTRSGTARKPARTAFLFSGQGAQYPGMGRELYASQPVFREAVDRCASLLQDVVPLVSLLTDPNADPAQLADTRVTQPLLFSFQYALASLWRTWGIEPDAVMGHSLGEYAAWCVAGAMSLTQALELVVRRAQLMAALPQGSMAAVVANEAQITGALAAGSGRVSVAAYNGPNNLVLAGPAADLDPVLAELSRAGIGTRRLAVSHAFHSAMMEPMLAPLDAVLREVRFEPSRTQIISNVSGAPIDPTSVGSEYFRDHTRKPVQFEAGVRTLLDSGVRTWIEIGPHPVLANLVKRIAPGEVETLPSMRQGTAARESMLAALAALHVKGHAPAWREVHHGLPTRPVALPAYPFDRQRYWAAASSKVLSAPVEIDPNVLHPLLDRVVDHSPSESTFEKRFSGADLAIAHHVVESIPILPGVGYVEAMLAAARWHLRRPALRVENVLIVSPLALDEDSQARMTVVAQSDGERVQLRVSSRRRDGSEVVHASCECVDTVTVAPPRLDLAALRARPAQRLDAALMYAGFERVGIRYGEFFRSIRWVARGERECLAELQLSAAAAASGGYLLHPALLDAALQSFAALITDSHDTTQLYVPLSVARVELHAPLGARVYVHARRTDSGTAANLPELVRGSLSIVDDAGRPLATVEEFSLKRVRLERNIADMIRSQIDSPRERARVVPGLVEELAAEQARLRALYAIESYSGVGSIVDALCTRYVIDALAALGCGPQPGAVVDLERIAAEHRLSTAHRKLLERMLQMLEQDGACVREANCWTWTEDDSRPRPPSIDELLRRSPACSGELTLLQRCGENLASALRGETTPLELLFPDGSLRLAEALYQDSPFARYYNGILQAAVRRIAALAGDRPLRVLEIGAGTGGTTSYALQALAGFDVQYVFSDVSRLFLALAEKKFRGYAGLEFELLDVEKSPATQGFEAAEFDLVIAANVLHATADLKASLEHVRWLLQPHGTLVLLEGTGRQRATDLIFGLTDGWWRFQDDRLADGYPLLSRQRWVELLRNRGFVDAVPVSQPDEATAWCEQLVIAAEADSRTAAPVLQPRAAAPVTPVELARVEAKVADVVSHTRDLIVAELATALRTTPDAIDVDQNFLDMGLDSLMAMEILGKLKARYQIDIPPTVLFEHTNAVALAEYLASRHADRLTTARPAPRPTVSRAVRASRERSANQEREPIAITGMACRFPGASNLEGFWRLLVEGRDAIREIPSERWDPQQTGGSPYAGILDHIERFDPLFFEISPREARLLDPQQRLFLEVAWEALEHAGSVANGTNTGVFVGCTNSDYFDRIKPYLTLDDYAAGLGNKNCIIPNRVSYALNLRGPSVLVDTACSSSLVALHTALQSLRGGECSQALVGGVNVLLSPLYYLALSRMGVQARDGRCKAFDHRADGFASGEGAAAIVLKPLSRALADGDSVYAVIRGSAVNHDGRSAGLAAPNPAAHAELIAAAYRDADVSPDTLSYIEAHGTGTALGDPIEIDGLTRAFRNWTQRNSYCAIGSVKSNIGHLEPAAGIAGVIKTVLCLSHRYLPPSLHFERPNPHIAFSETPFVVQAEGQAWEHVGPLRAGVSSFGMGGTNAHVVLEEPPPTAARAARPHQLWMLALSARTAPALRALITRYAEHLEEHPELTIEDVCFTAAAGRAAMKHRIAIVATDRDELAKTLTQLARGSNVESATVARGSSKSAAQGGAAGIAHTSRGEAERAAALFAQGAPLEHGSILGARKVALPSYPFEHIRCWVDPPAAKPAPEASPRPRRAHPFLQKREREVPPDA